MPCGTQQLVPNSVISLAGCSWPAEKLTRQVGVGDGRGPDFKPVDIYRLADCSGLQGLRSAPLTSQAPDGVKGPAGLADVKAVWPPP